MLPCDYCNLNFTKTILSWDEAIPLGNGLSGALLWGKSTAFRMSLDRGDIWDTTASDDIYSTEFTYKNMVNLAKKGDIENIRRIFDAPYNHALPSKLPAGKLIFNFKKDVNIVSVLDIAQATAKIVIDDIVIESFLHATEKYGYIKINKTDFDFKIENPAYTFSDSKKIDIQYANAVHTASLKTLCYPTPKIVNEDDTKYFIQKIDDEFSYGIFLKSKKYKNKTEMAYYVATSNDGKNWLTDSLLLLENALVAGYANAHASHSDWWKLYWDTSSICIPDKFFEKNWYVSNYLLASCSRKGSFPMPLQGVWTADNDALPPWKGDYHHDLNTELCYYSYIKANHLNEGESFIDFLWDTVCAAQKFAKSYYNSDGLCLPSTMTLDANPLGGWGMYSMSPTNQAWLCQVFERHYRFTGDIEFLKTRAYPYMAEVGIFILGLLEEKDGLYYLPISSSPEIHDDTIKSFLTPHSNYDLSLMRYLFKSLIDLSHRLCNDDFKKWQDILNRLPQLAVDKRNVLMLSPDEVLTESHRHLAHAMAIHPLRILKYDTEEGKKIIDATIHNLEVLGTGLWVGYSFTWMAELYAIAKNGNGAAYQLKVFWNNHCTQNGFHVNGDYKKRGTSQFHYRPFTLEGNFCAADALQEMVLYSEDNKIEVFPAIDDDWRSGEVSFENLRAENGLFISAKMIDGTITCVKVRATKDTKFTYTGKEFELTAGGEIKFFT